MAIVPNPYKTTGFLGWIDDRFPLTKLWRDHLTEYYAPKNFNFWYYFGSLALLVLVNQLLSGIILAMHYKPSAAEAFGSVEYIMRDVPWGNVIRRAPRRSSSSSTCTCIAGSSTARSRSRAS
jgi:ubiquinol-cytochrome c reductase cytochrome b subunit